MCKMALFVLALAAGMPTVAADLTKINSWASEISDAADSIVLPIVAYLFFCLTLYPSISASQFASIGLVTAALGAPRLVALCPEANIDPLAGASALWSTLTAVMFAIVIRGVVPPKKDQ